MPFFRSLYGAGRAREMAWVEWPEAVAARFLDDQFKLQTDHFKTHHAAADDAVVTAQGVAVGRLLVDRTMRPWRLIDIGLIDHVQGHGWGGALLGWLQRSARSDGAGGLDLHVAFDNPRAEALYRRLGFEEAPNDKATHRRLLWTVS
jgi:ribosomal protein S18 acetylase RimI-like enzyme